MKPSKGKTPPTDRVDPGTLKDLVKQLYRTEQAVAEAAGPVDSVILDDGRPWLLPQAREDLHRSEELFQAFMQHLPGIAFIKTTDGRHIFVNAEWQKVFQVRPDQVMGRKDDELWPEAVARQTMQNDRHVIDHRESLQTVEIVPDTRGDRHWMVSKFPIYDHEDHVTMIGGVALDITAQIHTERDLAARTHELRERVKELDCLVRINWILERSGRITAEVLQQIVETIPPAMQYPDSCCARIRLDQGEYRSAGFRESPWRLNQDILVRGHPVGSTDVYYLQEFPPAHDGPFLREELDLIEMIAQKIGRFAGTLRVQQELLESERFAIGTLNGLSANIAILEEDGTILRTNAAWRAFARENAGGLNDLCEGANYLSVCDTATGQEREMARESAGGIRRVLDGREEEFVLEYPCHSPEQQRWFIARVTPFPDTGPRRLIVAHEDITDQKLAELSVLRLNRVHNLLSGINSLIVHVRDRETLFTEACRLAVETGQFRLAWIGLLSPDGKTMVPAAWSGDESGYLQHFQRIFNDPEVRPDLLSNEALRTMQATVRNNLAKDGVSFYLKQEALKRGYRSVAALPLQIAENRKGLMMLYSGETDFFDAEETKLLSELAGDISYALQNLLKQERLDYLISYDPVTGFPNQARFQDHLTGLLRRAARDQSPVTVLVWGIEQFRHINNAFGRTVSDGLITETATRIRLLDQNPEDIAHITSDTFAMIFKGDRETAGRFFEERLQQTMTRPFYIQGQGIHIHIKAGIAAFPDDHRQADGLFHAAEAALEQARVSGTPYRYYQQDMITGIARHIQLQNDLRNALVNHEFVLHYQPKYNMITDRVCGLEALIRWDRPGQGMVPPSEFIPILEESDLILDVSSWILEQAARDWLAWGQKIQNVPRIAVNVSMIQLRQDDFVGQMGRAVEQGEQTIPLDLEITESLLMYDIDDTIGKLDAIRAAGLQVAIDDFGTGYSSLSYIARLPADYLKIDRSFIITMTEHPESMTIVATIITLAHSLGLKVIAEGVETEEQAKLLRLLRCDEVQGYLYSRPLPFGEIAALLGKNPLP